MKTFNVDLGSVSVGWAYMDGTALKEGGSWKLTSARTESPGVRWILLRRFLDRAIEGLRIDVVGFEEVRRHNGTSAAHAYGASKAILMVWCEDHGFEFASVTVSAVKRAAVGKGGGKGTAKSAIIAAARARWPAFPFHDDDSADAAFIGVAIHERLG